MWSWRLKIDIITAWPRNSIATGIYSEEIWKHNAQTKTCTGMFKTE
jgi:hypothetical protein